MSTHPSSAESHLIHADEAIRHKREARAQRERDEARQYAATLAAQVQQAIDWCIQDDAEPMVAVHALKRFLRDFPPPEGVR